MGNFDNVRDVTQLESYVSAACVFTAGLKWRVIVIER